MEHEYFCELLSAQRDGETTPEEDRQLAEHLEGCEECRAFRDALSHLSFDGELPPEGLHEETMALLRREALRRKNRRLAWLPLLTSAAALVIVLYSGGKLHAASKLLDSMSSGSTEIAAVTEESYEAPEEAPAENSGTLLLPELDCRAGLSEEQRAVLEEGEGAALPDGAAERCILYTPAETLFIYEAQGKLFRESRQSGEIYRLAASWEEFCERFHL